MASALSQLIWYTLSVAILFAVAYGLVVLVSRVWFRAKLNYQRRLIEDITGGVENGKSTEEQE